MCYRKGNMAFTPFSVELGESLTEVHRQLRLAVRRETSPIALIQILNTLSTLAALTPFRRFPSSGLLKALFVEIQNFLLRTDREYSFRR
jgi:hypothetical protein